ncbi:MAG: Tol-Pal system protein TolB [Chlamydiota bacterium]
MGRIFGIWLAVISVAWADEEMEVALSTESVLFPTYVAAIENKDQSFSSLYVESLEKILQFDLKYAGYFFLLPKEEAKEKVLLQDKEGFRSVLWNKKLCMFVMKPAIVQKKLSLQVFLVESKGIKKFSEISLSGVLSKDRKKIHQLTDTLIEGVLQKKGFALAKVLYTVRTPVQGQSKKWISELWVCDYDGANGVALTRENSYCVHPIFFPRKNSSIHEILYVSYKTGQPKIYLSSLEKAEATTFVSLRGNQLIPSLSPNGNRLAFISDAAGRPDLFVQKLDSDGKCCEKPIQLFSFPRATEASPSFSPDGEKLSFVSDKDGSPRIYIMKIPESNSFKTPYVQVVTRRNKINVTPAWSPDGTKLAYSAKTSDIYQIWIYDFVTDEEWQLTKGPGNKENPSWAPDSMHVIYNTEDAGSAELYMTNLHQMESVKIMTAGGGRKRFPCWEPARR